MNEEPTFQLVKSELKLMYLKAFFKKKPNLINILFAASWRGFVIVRKKLEILMPGTLTEKNY